MVPYIDMHCDTLGVLRKMRKGGADVSWEEAGLAVDVPGMEKGRCLCQNLAMFVNLYAADGFMEDGEDAKPCDPFLPVQEMKALFDGLLTENAERIMQVRNAAEIERAAALGKAGVMLTVEEGGVCGGEISRLDDLHAMGVRMLTLTWNYENELGHPNSSPYAVSGVTNTSLGVQHSYKGAMRHEPGLIRPLGLKKTGFAFVEHMREIGMIADVSHLSDDGFFDVADCLKGPFVASHSNTRSLCPCPRNLTDAMIRRLAECGGAAGLAFFPGFVDPGENPKQTTALLAAHARHLIDVGGIGCVALGSDFDGCSGEMEIDSAGKMQLLAEGLASNGLTADEIEHVFYKNALRVYRDVLG